MDNSTISQHLLRHARELEDCADNLYRVQAYRRAAETVQRLDRPLADILASQGRRGLQALAGVGAHLAVTLERLLETGQFRTLSPAHDAEEQVSSLPGVGPVIMRSLEERLGVTTVTELLRASQDGRLDEIGLGPRRVQRLRAALAGRLTTCRRVETVAGEPSVAELLAVDEEYRRTVQTHKLQTATSYTQRLDGDVRLPLLHTCRGDWRYRALYANTALAHRLNQTRDWVAISFDGGQGHGQRTVVTETHGELRGCRVVRARESECRDHYRRTATAS